MLCPNCSYTLSKYKAGTHEVLHCDVCGGTFFDEGVIDRLTRAQAQELAKIQKDHIITDTPKMCPRDQSFLGEMQNENIPPSVSLLSCPVCRGVFAYADDLLTYKRAQDVKSEYFKLWAKPMAGSLKTMAFVAVLLVIGVTTYNVMTFLNQPTNINSQAKEPISNIYVSPSGSYLLVSFYTNSPSRSKIVFSDKTTRTSIEKVVSKDLATFHYLTTSDVQITNEIYYQILIYNDKGEEVGRTEKLRYVSK